MAGITGTSNHSPELLIPETEKSPGLTGRIFQPLEKTLLSRIPVFRGESADDNKRFCKKSLIAHEFPKVMAAAAVKPVPRKFLRLILLVSIAFSGLVLKFK
jgi:hypothetical protein